MQATSSVLDAKKPLGSADVQASGWALPGICLAASVIPVLMLVTAVILRRGFVTPIVPLAKLTGLSLLVINASAMGSRKLWQLSGPAVSLLILILLSVLGLSPLAEIRFLTAVLSGLGVLLCLYNAARWVLRAGVPAALLLLLLGLFLGAYAESMYWRSGTEHDILYPEALITGQAHTDVVQQAAVVHMIATFRLATTGVDGLVPLKYHNGSLWMAEGLRRLCGFRPLEFVAFGYGIVLIPLYIAAFLSAAYRLRGVVYGENASPPVRFWAVCVVALIGLFPFVNDPLLVNFNETILNSDSFLLSIAVTLLLVGVAARAYPVFRVRPPGNYERLAIIILLPAALALVGFIKISQIYLLLALFWYLCVRVNWMRRWHFLTAAVLCTVVLLYLLDSEVGANKSFVAPFNFDRIHPEWIPYFFVFYFIWVWLFILVWSRAVGVTNVVEFRAAIRQAKSMPVELVAAAAGAGLLPYLLLNFNSPAWKFFTEFQAVLAGVFVAAYIGNDPSRFWSKLRAGELSIPALLYAGLAVAVAGHLCMTTGGSVYRMLKRSGEIRSLLAGHPAGAWKSALRHLGSERVVTAEGLPARIQVMRCLSRLSERSLEERRAVALYIPKTNRTYWDMRQAGQGATPFIAPALSGMAMVEGLPEFDDIGWAAIGWGYPQYNLPEAPEPPRENLEQAMRKARADGFKQLLVFRGVEPSSCTLQLIPLS